MALSPFNIKGHCVKTTVGVSFSELRVAFAFGVMPLLGGGVRFLTMMLRPRKGVKVAIGAEVV